MVNAASDALRDELQELIREREREGVRGPRRTRRPGRLGGPDPAARPERGRGPPPVAAGRGDPGDLRGARPVDRGVDPPDAQRERGRRSSSPGWTPTTPPTSSRTCPTRTSTRSSSGCGPRTPTEIRTLANYEPDTAGGLMTPGVRRRRARGHGRRRRSRRSGASSTRPRPSTTSTSSTRERHLLGVLSLYRLMLSAGRHAGRRADGADDGPRPGDRRPGDRRPPPDRPEPPRDPGRRRRGPPARDHHRGRRRRRPRGRGDRGHRAARRLRAAQRAVPRSRACRCSFRKRIGWLLLLFVAEAYTGTVLRDFQDELAAVVALSFFIPLLIGTGGNVGSQTVTLIVRAMALGEVSLRDVGWIVFKEVRVGLLLGRGHGGRRVRPGARCSASGSTSGWSCRSRSSRSASGRRRSRRSCRWPSAGCGSTRRSSRRR